MPVCGSRRSALSNANGESSERHNRTMIIYNMADKTADWVCVCVPVVTESLDRLQGSLCVPTLDVG